MYFTTLDDDTFRWLLGRVCEILTEVIEEDRAISIREQIAHNRATVQGRAHQPAHTSLPTGQCTFVYECTRPIAHWRYIKEKDQWIPVCRIHRGRR